MKIPHPSLDDFKSASFFESIDSKPRTRMKLFDPWKEEDGGSSSYFMWIFPEFWLFQYETILKRFKPTRSCHDEGEGQHPLWHRWSAARQSPELHPAMCSWVQLSASGGIQATYMFSVVDDIWFFTYSQILRRCLLYIMLYILSMYILDILIFECGWWLPQPVSGWSPHVTVQVGTSESRFSNSMVADSSEGREKFTMICWNRFYVRTCYFNEKMNL